MRQSSRVKLAISLVLAISISTLTAAFASPSKFVSVSRIPRQLAGRKNDGFREKETDVESSADIIPRGGANINDPPPKLPSLSTYRKFALPCLGLWVANPLLSLIDTSFVGLSGDKATSAQQLAALGVSLYTRPIDDVFQVDPLIL